MTADPNTPAPIATATTTVTTEESSTVQSNDPSSIHASESSMLGITVRAWLTTLIIGTVCYLSIIGKEIFEPLYGMALLTIGFYFGSATPSRK